MIAAQIAAIFLAGFAALWLGITTLLRKMMKMSKQAPSPSTTGAKLAKSRWGTAMVNNISCKNSVKIIGFENGIELQLMPIFGRGYLWLPKDELRIGAEEQSRRLIKSIAIRQLSTREHKVTLTGHLADFIASTKLTNPARKHDSPS